MFLQHMFSVLNLIYQIFRVLILITMIQHYFVLQFKDFTVILIYLYQYHSLLIVIQGFFIIVWAVFIDL